MVLGSKFVLLTVLVLFVVCSNVEGGCSWSCSVRCRVMWGRRRCGLSCRLRCSGGWRRKRSIQDQEEEFRLFPNRFKDYDSNKDGVITIKEFAKAVDAKADSEGTKNAFNSADKDGDKKIDCKEFRNAPYLYNHDPTCK